MLGDAKALIGRMIHSLRESAGLSQEKLAQRAGMSYQYLSSVENGKKNFTVGVLESLAAALGLSFAELVDRAFADDRPVPTVKEGSFIREVELPPRLSINGLESALNETHRLLRLISTTLRRASGRPLSQYIQRNNFSGIVSNVLCDSFSRLTPFKHNHDQRYPDLICSGASGTSPIGLEVKSTIRPGKGGESHNGHSGWHVIACYSLDEDSGDIRFVHVMFAELIAHDKRNADWKYSKSKVNKKTGSQRTETYATTPRGTAKLRHGTAYLDTEYVDIRRWRTCQDVKAPSHSPFARKSD